MKDSKAFIEYSNDMDDIYKNIEEYNPHNKWKILIFLDEVIDFQDFMNLYTNVLQTIFFYSYWYYSCIR